MEHSRGAPAAITFAGHATALIDTGEARIVTDPLLRDGLLVVLRRHGGVDRARLGRVDGVLISHLHRDHLDLPSLRALGDPPIVVPEGAGSLLRRRRFTSVTELAPGGTTTLAGVQVRGVEAHHRGGRMFGIGGAGAVGYLLEGSARVYYAGDTELFAGMVELGPGLDVALLPVWGWGPKPGEGHLDPETAAQALALLRPRMAIPVHWGALALLGIGRFWHGHLEAPGRSFAAHARRLAPEVDVRVLAPGETAELPR